MTTVAFKTRGPGAMEKTAVLSSDGLHRYKLTRRWGTGRALLFIMLNPSTADANLDDPTIRKCIGFAQRMGHNAITVVNLYAFRATDPRVLGGLLDDRYAVGPDNDTHIIDELHDVKSAICAWGASAFAEKKRVASVMQLLEFYGVEARCLGVTAGGRPRHPLMLAYRSNTMPYPVGDGL